MSVIASSKLTPWQICAKMAGLRHHPPVMVRSLCCLDFPSRKSRTHRAKSVKESPSTRSDQPCHTRFDARLRLPRLHLIGHGLCCTVRGRSSGTGNEPAAISSEPAAARSLVGGILVSHTEATRIGCRHWIIQRVDVGGHARFPIACPDRTPADVWPSYWYWCTSTLPDPCRLEPQRYVEITIELPRCLLEVGSKSTSGEERSGLAICDDQGVR